MRLCVTGDPYETAYDLKILFSCNNSLINHREIGNEAVIVFVTSYGESAIARYEVEVFRYLLKPNLDEKLPRIVTALVEKLARQHTTIVVKTTRGEIIIDSQEILFCEKAGRHYYIVVHMENAI